MNTTAKIDFEPGLFDEGQPDAAPDLPAIQPKRRANRAPFIVAGGLLLVLAAAFFAINTTTKPKTAPAVPLEATEKPLGAFLQPAPRQGSQIVRNTPVGDSEGFCVGFEAMCSTSTTDKPAETLAKLAAALPVGEAKRYRVKVSVVPLDE
ncbi:TPA: hypothetical protein QHC62_005064 [Citrobacter freundii]|nr:hypothetical protein [Citrobacter freundii]